MEIRKLKQVEEIANKYFRCIVRPIHETHAKGYKGIKLVVGWKANPAYDPNIDPNNPPLELRANPELLKNKTNPKAPDVRIIWLPPGTTEEELIEKWIIPIQNSLKEKKPIYEAKEKNVTKIGGESDADLAAKVVSGEKIDSRFDEWEDGYENEEEISEVENSQKETLKPFEPKPEKEAKKEEKKKDEVIETLSIMSENISILVEDIKNLDKRLSKLEKSKKSKK